jgi:hypothetical protein
MRPRYIVRDELGEKTVTREYQRRQVLRCKFTQTHHRVTQKSHNHMLNRNCCRLARAIIVPHGGCDAGSCGSACGSGLQ